MTTLADVAQRAGVSTTTVSHVLNASRPVAALTRALVLEAVEELGYVPNHQARSLVRAQTQQLGVAISMRTHHFAELVSAIEEAATEAGYTLLIGNTTENPETERRVVEALRSRRVDGLLIAPSPEAGPILESLERSGLPTVLLDRVADPRFDVVHTENIEPFAALVAHLAAIGHRRIALLSGMEGLTTSEQRIEGYRIGLARAGIAFDPDLVACGGSHTEMTYAAVDSLLRVDPPPTAFAAANNTMLVATMRALQQRGLAVPDDAALVGFDDFDWADAFSPRLSTVAQDNAAIGRRAVQMLLERIAGTAQEPRQVELPATVVHRDSCGCTAPDEPLTALHRS